MVDVEVAVAGGADKPEEGTYAVSAHGIGSILDSICRKSRIFDCRLVKRAGWVWMTDKAELAVVASIAGSAAEKTEAEELIL